MDEYYSDSNDCYELVRKLYKNLGGRIYIYGSPYNPLINGKYKPYNNDVTSNRRDYYAIRDGLCFYAKYNKESFLRIGIGDPYNRKASDGEKLAALSDIYYSLHEDFGNPDVFYTTKDDDEGTLSMQWIYKDKELELEKFEFDEYFDDAKLERVVFIEKDSLNKELELPQELAFLVDEDFNKFKGLDNTKVLRKKL